MAIGQTTVHIDGDDYMITHFPTTKGLAIEVKLVKLLGPAFMEMQKAAQNEGNEDSVMASAITCLIGQMDNIDVVALVKELVAGVTIGTKSINFDHDFAGRHSVLFELVKEVLKFNFADVFSKLGLKGQ